MKCENFPEAHPQLGINPQSTSLSARSTAMVFVLLLTFCGTASAGTHQLLTRTDNSTNVTLCAPPVDVSMVTITTNGDKGGNEATDTTVTVGGTVAAADVAEIRVYYGGAQAGSVTNPGSLTGVNILLPTQPEKGGSAWAFHVFLKASAAGKTFNLTVTSIAGTDNAGLPFTTATRNANGCANSPPTATVVNPANGSNISGASYNVTGTASDSDGTVTAVDVQIQRQDNGQYWNGSAWQAGAAWLAATGTTSWSYTWNWDNLDGVNVNVTARATNNAAATGTDTNATNVDNWAPRIANGVRFQALPSSGDANFTLLSDWTEANPGTPRFDYNLNAAGYLGLVNGSAGNASSRTFAVALNGDDRFLAIRSDHTDARGNGPTVSEDTTVRYVLPLTPPAPTVGGATDNTLDVTINANGSETGVNMLYAVREAGGLYVQADGTLGASPVYRTFAAWGSPLTVTGLAAGTGYTFSVSAGNPSDATPTSGERSASAFGAGAGGTTTSPVLAVTLLAVTHVMSGCDVVVRATHSGDSNGNSTALFEANQTTNCNAGGYATLPGCSSVTGASPRECTHVGPVAGQDWCYRVTYTDPDGVTGSPIKYGMNTGACVPATTTTVTDGANPGNAAICPNDVRFVDAFVLSSSPASDTVTNIQVTLGGEVGIFNYLTKVEITNDAGSVVYGTVNNPGADVVNVAVNIPVNTTAVQYKIRVTAESHANLASPTHTVEARVTDITVASSKSVNDASSATLTIDNTAPGAATWGTVTPNDKKLTLTWTNPGGDFAQAMVIRSDNNAPVTYNPPDGTTYILNQTVAVGEIVRYLGAGSSFTDTGLTNGSNYYYTIFTRDACGNWSSGVGSGAQVPAIQPVNLTLAGIATATATACDEVIAYSPFSGDDDADGNSTFKRGTAPGGPFGTTICNSLTGASPRPCTDNTVASNSTYYYQVTYADLDGVSGTAVQVVGPVTTPDCGTFDTNVTSNAATATSCEHLTTTTIFTGDGDADGGTLVEYRVNGSPTFNDVGCTAVVGTSPRQCVISGLLASTTYDLRFTTSDPDGTSGVASQTLNGLVTTPACGGDQRPPTVTVRVPARDAVLGGQEVVKLQVFEANLSTVQVSVDGGVYAAAALNANYTCGNSCGVWEYTLDTTVLSNGSHYLMARATDASGNVGLVAQPFGVNNSGAVAGGDGFLLRRARGSQLCIDCHTVATHSSQDTGTRYGNWSIDCLTCHTPHLTENIYLIREQIRTPNNGTKKVVFIDDTVGFGFTSDGTAPEGYVGICEVCHTKTIHHRNDDSPGADHTHKESNKCMECHEHGRGFFGESCISCHNSPPTTIGRHSTHDEVWDSTILLTTESYTDLTSHATITQYGFACAKCHFGPATNHKNDITNNPTHDGTVANPWQVEVAFDTGGTFSGVYKQNTDSATPSGETWSWSNGSCTVYCHSNATPLGGSLVYASPLPTWNAPVTGDCTICHDGAGVATGLSNAHRLHTGTYGFGCVRCHDATVADNTTIADKTMHVNGTKNIVFNTNAFNVDAVYDGVAHTCTDSYCHTDGTDLAGPFTHPASIAWDTNRDCGSCHGAGSDPTPVYGNGSPKANSHTAHVPAFSCDVCHANVVNATPAIVTPSLHVNGAYNLQAGSGYSFSPSGSPTTCATNACHGDLTWGQTGVGCRTCHLISGAGDVDVDDWVYGNGTTALVDAEDWIAFGHGNAAGYAESTNPAANFDGGGDGCLYCHDTGVSHNVASNPFRLLNVGAGATAAEKNGVCTVCHGGGGFDPDGGGGLPNINATKNIDAYHYGNKHAGNSSGGTFCWDCHDPHGDTNYTGQPLAYMIQNAPTEDHSGAGGWGIPTGLAPATDFRANRDGAGAWGWGDYVAATQAGGFYRGVCQVCHDVTVRFQSTAGYETHQSTGGRCTSCHDHQQPPDTAFAAAGGDCRGCHWNDSQGAAPFARRPVGADFDDGTTPNYRSHHGGSSTVNTLQGAITNFDCVVCHAEGEVQGAETGTTSYHNDFSCANLAGTPNSVSCIDLKDADTGTVYRYNKDKLVESVGPMGTNLANWSSNNAEWRAEQANAMDPFCLSCHDSTGASLTHNATDGGTATNPFADNAITNNSDQKIRGDAGDPVGKVVDIGSMMQGSPTVNDDPPDGIYARHAIRGQSVSHNTKYQALGGSHQSMWEYGVMIQQGVTPSGEGPLWNDTSVMACADCHTNDGANNSAGNAHGANSEYLLKDSTGAAVEHTDATYICFKCHDINHYDNTHANDSNSDFRHTYGVTGADRLLDRGNWTGMACATCHGGAPGVGEGDYKGFGRIHGTSSTFTRYSGGTRATYRFTNGAGLRFWQNTTAGAWDFLGSKTNAAFSCYTLNTSTDKWSGCTQHGSSPASKARVYSRPAEY